MKGKLVVSEGGRDRVHEICEEVLVVGRGPQATLHLRDPGIRGPHCEIRHSKQGFKLVDLESASGTFVNGQPVNQHFLNNGDTIRIGEVRLTYLGDSAKRSVPARQPLGPPLQALPRRDDGSPQRFYRHESRRGRNGPLVLGAVILVLAAVAGFLYWQLEKKPYIRPERIQFERAKTLMHYGDIDSLLEAERLLAGIREGTVPPSELEVLRARLEQILPAARENDLAAKSGQEALRIQSVYRGEFKDIYWLRAEVRHFMETFPGSSAGADLQALLDKAELSEAGVSFDQAQERMRNAVRHDDFKTAFAILTGLEDSPAAMKVHEAAIRIARATLVSDFQDYFSKARDAALKAYSDGKKDAAVALLTGLVETGQEPYASQAKAILDTMK